MFTCVSRSIPCAHACISPSCHFPGEITLRGQEMKLSRRSLRPFWPRMYHSPGAHVCRASQRFPRRLSQDIVSANVIQQEYWLEWTAGVPPAPVSIAHWTICYPHMQILSFKTCYRRISQRFCLTELEPFFPKYIRGGAQYHTFKTSWMGCFSQRADFSSLGT